MEHLSKVFSNIVITPCLKSNFILAKKMRIANTLEELTIATSYLTSLFYTVWISSFLFLFRVETKYSIDIKLLSLLIFLCISSSLLYYLFKKAKYKTIFAEIDNFNFSLFIYISTIVVTLLFLGFAIVYQYTEGNLQIVIEYLKYKF
jgi:hypothetical protein